MKLRHPRVWTIVVACSLAGSGLVLGHQTELNDGSAPLERSKKTPEPAESKQTGLAAFYHMTFQGRRTANGESFDHGDLTAAHKTLPFGTLVRVTNLHNQKSLIVRVNDRGPMQADRVIDVTQRAAGLLGFVQQGMTRVALEVLPVPAPGK